MTSVGYLDVEKKYETFLIYVFTMAFTAYLLIYKTILHNL